jgi:hypothetical protein
VHSLIFWASADATHNVNAFVQLPNSPWTDIADFGDAVIVPGWHRYVMTATGGQTYSSGQLKICAGDTVGTVRFDNITLQQGTVDVWRRPYSGGMAVVNGGTSTLVVPLGGVYRRLLGTQARSANNGRVATVVTLAPHSGLVLATCDTLKVTDALAAARTADLGAASDARAARSHYLTLSHHGSRAARAKAVKAAAAWKTAANAASAAATAADKALTRLLIDSPGGGIYLERAQTAADLARRRSNTAYSLGRGSSAPRARSRARTADTLIDGVAVSAR